MGISQSIIYYPDYVVAYGEICYLTYGFVKTIFEYISVSYNNGQLQINLSSSRLTYCNQIINFKFITLMAQYNQYFYKK